MCIGQRSHRVARDPGDLPGVVIENRLGVSERLQHRVAHDDPLFEQRQPLLRVVRVKDLHGMA